MKGPKEGGLRRRIVCDVDEINLGYEGAHLYKKDGKYYLFTCHMLKSGNAWKTEDCFIADSLTGEFKGKCILKIVFRFDGWKGEAETAEFFYSTDGKDYQNLGKTTRIFVILFLMGV